MDIFAVGCVLAELFLNGDRVFDYTDLNRYRRGELQLNVVLKGLNGQPMFPILEKMMSLQAESRPDIVECCQIWQSNVFPSCFSKVIFPLLSPMISTSIGKSDSDEIVNLLVENSQHLWRYLLRQNTYIHYETGEIKEMTLSEDAGLSDPHSIMVIIDLICSHFRNLKKPKFRSLSIDMIRSFTPHINDDNRLHRVLPYLVSIMTDKEEKGLIIVNALNTVVELIAQVKTLRPQGAGIFQEYIWPAIASLRQSSSILVRKTLCQSLPEIAQHGRKLLELTLNFTHGSDSQLAFDKTFSDMCNAIFSIFRDQSMQSNKALQAVICSVLPQIPKITGWEFALDLLSKLQRDWSKASVTVQRRWTELLARLMSDTAPEAVGIMALRLVEVGLFSNDEAFMYYSLLILEKGNMNVKVKLEQLQRCKALIFHPNVWIRSTFISAIREIMERLTPADNYLFLVPLLKNTLQIRHTVYQITATILDTCLSPPLPRSFLHSTDPAPSGYSAEAIQDVRDFFTVVIPYGERLSIEPADKPTSSIDKITQYTLDRLVISDRLTEPSTGYSSTTSVREDFLSGRLSERTSFLKKPSLSRPLTEVPRNVPMAEQSTLKGNLVQVLAEHNSPVISINSFDVQQNAYIVTLGLNGTVKLWNLTGLLNPETAEIRSQTSESLPCQRVRAATILVNSKHALVAVESYKANPFEQPSNGFRICSFLEYPLESFYPLREELGTALSLQPLPAEQLFAYTTQSGTVAIGDLRLKSTALECNFGRQMGLFMTSAVGEEGQSVIAGSTSGYVLVYDIRFNSASSLFAYSKKGCITSISPWKPDRHVCFSSLIDSEPYVAIACGTGDTDMSLFSLATGRSLCYFTVNNMSPVVPYLIPEPIAMPLSPGLQYLGSPHTAQINEVYCKHYFAAAEDYIKRSQGLGQLLTPVGIKQQLGQTGINLKKMYESRNTVAKVVPMYQPSTLISCGFDAKIRLWNLQNPKLSRDFDGGQNVYHHQQLADTYVVMEQSTFQASVSPVTGPRTGEMTELSKAQHNGDILDARLCRAGSYLVTAGRDGTVRVWE